MGLAGLGDLVLTCTGGLSRNRYVGQELGRGRTSVLSKLLEVEGYDESAPGGTAIRSGLLAKAVEEAGKRVSG